MILQILFLLQQKLLQEQKFQNATGTVENKALWTEEYLPQDSILYSIAMTSPVWANEDKKSIFKGIKSDDEAQKVLDFFNDHFTRKSLYWWKSNHW